MQISIETHITCDFPVGGGGGRAPYSPSGSARDIRANVALILPLKLYILGYT